MLDLLPALMLRSSLDTLLADDVGPRAVLLSARSSVRSRAALQIEVLPLRHQLRVLKRSRPQRLRLTGADRLLWVWVSRTWKEWQTALLIVKPETVIAWHRQGLRLFWTPHGLSDAQ